MVKDPDAMRQASRPIAAMLIPLLTSASLVTASPLMAMDGPQASSMLEQEDMSNRENVDPSTGGQVDSTTGEHVDTSTVTGDPFYCGERKLGTWFYCERPKPKPSDTSASANAASPSYRQQLDKIGARLEELKAKAILEPTSDNIIAYVRYQREQLDRASTFADVWERAIWQHPDLDYTLQRPVSTLGKTAWLAQRKTDREAVIASLSERYGLFFFYSSSCGACEVFSPSSARSRTNTTSRFCRSRWTAARRPPFRAMSSTRASMRRWALKAARCRPLCSSTPTSKSRSPSAMASWPRMRCCNASSI
jgi:conjugal transfer pilus assembly protein TraF